MNWTWLRKKSLPLARAIEEAAQREKASRNIFAQNAIKKAIG